MNLTSNNLKKLYSGTLAAALIVALTAPTEAASYFSAAPDSDVAMCVAEVAEHANYDDAGRVRHEVVTTKRRSVGYRLDIDTTVYDTKSGAVIREYESTCYATGRSKPWKFEISEKGA